MPTQLKPSRESVNFRLDPRLLRAARKKADKENTSLTALVVRGLNFVLGNPSIEDCIDSNVEIQERLDDLTNRMEEVEALIYSASCNNLQL